MKLDILYFAWVRERIGEHKETVETSAETVAQLIDELCVRGERYALALSDMDAIRVAVDQTLVGLDGSLKGAREVAIFPPMTGG